MKKMLDEFKAFAMRGNVIDLAVGVIIGGAFGKIVSSVVNDLIMPLIAYVMGGTSFADMGVVLRAATVEGEADLVFAYGKFIQSAVDFLIIAFSIFILVRFLNNMKKKEVEVEATPAEPVEDTLSVLKDIREQLKTK
ncbi:MAG TPA: large conductance mechanosensitive channel protein MscL [Erysipelotrichaceae bacterium]|nr:large conductance mechanosensitive channel protein MscL [Erysipelotrichaceae bacterium]